MTGYKGTSELAGVISMNTMKVVGMAVSDPVLGSIVGSEVQLDNLDTPIPLSEFEVYEPDITLIHTSGTQQDYKMKLRLKSGDRILCVPTGGAFLIMGQVK